MTNANDMASPDPLRGHSKHESPQTEDAGLTKREYFAALAMQGLFANPDNMKFYFAAKQPSGGSSRWGAEVAVQAADELILALNKQP